MRRFGSLATLALSLACAPATLELGPFLGTGEHVFLLIERNGELEIHPLDQRPWARARSIDLESWYILAAPRDAVRAAHPRFDEARADEVALSLHPKAELETCSIQGVLAADEDLGSELLIEPSRLKARFFDLDGDQWRETELPRGGPLGDLAIRVPIRSNCQRRTWRGEPFFDRSPLFTFGLAIRGFEFPVAWPRALEVRGLEALGDGAYLIYSQAVLAVARPGGAVSAAASLLVTDLPPPPSEWASGGPELGWQFHDVERSTSSSSGTPSFFVVLQARVKGQEESGQEYGRALAEVVYREGQLHLDRVIHVAATDAPELIQAVAPLGNEGGFVGIGPEALFTRATGNAPVEVWPSLWSPASIDRVDLPGAEFIISIHPGGFWVGDPRRGFEGLRFEAVEPRPSGCLWTHRVRRGAREVAVANCGRDTILIREDEGWVRFEPWLPATPGCTDERPHCGRPRLEDDIRFTSFGPGLDGELLVSKDDCRVSFSFSLDESRCGRAEIFDVLPLVVTPRDGGLDLYGLRSIEGSSVLFGQGGLVAKVTPGEETVED